MPIFGREGGLRILVEPDAHVFEGGEGPPRLRCRRARRRCNPCRAEAEAGHAAGGGRAQAARQGPWAARAADPAPDGKLFVFGAAIRE